MSLCLCLFVSVCLCLCVLALCFRVSVPLFSFVFSLLSTLFYHYFHFSSLFFIASFVLECILNNLRSSFCLDEERERAEASIANDDSKESAGNPATPDKEGEDEEDGENACDFCGKDENLKRCAR